MVGCKKSESLIYFLPWHKKGKKVLKHKQLIKCKPVTWSKKTPCNDKSCLVDILLCLTDRGRLVDFILVEFEIRQMVDIYDNIKNSFYVQKIGQSTK